ncbi:MAG: oxidoreductase, short chain dehydrogenase [Ignavibacteria bacterium]|nr:oxidoreductase, short chain dehydrogenase [Ignavibacteria bacterium]
MVKTVFITGASRGIGRALALEYAKKGSLIVLSSRNTEDLNKVKSWISSNGGTCHTIHCNVASLDEMREAANQAKKLLGNIDLAILNAGFAESFLFSKSNPESLVKIFEVNVFGLANGLSCLVPIMLEQGGGTIAGVGSLAESRGIPGNAAYCASKSAAGHLLEAARCELAPKNIKVMTIKPGFVRTEMTSGNQFNMPFLIDPDEAAKIIVKGIEKEKRIIAFPLIMSLFSYFGKSVPAALFDLILSGRTFHKSVD